MATEQVNKLLEENMELKAELQEVKENYNGLKVGVYSSLKGDNEVKKANLARLVQQGKATIAKAKKSKEFEPVG